MAIKNGFTIIEVLVSISIIAIVSTVVVQAFAAISRAATKTEKIKEIKQNGDFAIDAMERSIRSSASVQNCTGAATSTLSLVDTDGVVSTYALATVGSIKRITLNSTNYLTSELVTTSTTLCPGVPEFQFICSSYGGDNTKFIVDIAFCLTSVGSQAAAQDRAFQGFTHTVSNRN